MKCRLTNRVLCWGGAVFAVACALLLVIAVRYSAHAARMATCARNLLFIQDSICRYEIDHGAFPPAYTTDAGGKPLHSWRVLILPYLSESARSLYSQIRLDEPWSSPHNRALAKHIPEYYRCPADSCSIRSTMTNYTAVVGPLGAWHGAEVAGIPLAGGYRRTIMVVEVVGSGIDWMEPRDLSFEDACAGVNTGVKPGISSHHLAGANCSFADDTTSVLRNDISPHSLRTMLTVLAHAGNDDN